MIDRYFITLGAPTTAGGKVTSSSRFETIDGAPVAVEGDTCWCPTCLSEGVIPPDGPRLSDTIDGRPDLAYQLDLASTQVESTLDHKGWTDPLSEAERASSVTVQPGTAYA